MSEGDPRLKRPYHSYSGLTRQEHNLLHSYDPIEHASLPEVKRDRRVVITAIGGVTPLGLTMQSSFEAAIDGMVGVTRFPEPIPHVDAKVGALLPKEFDENERLAGLVETKEIRRLHRAHHITLAAGDEAMKASGLLGPNRKLDEKFDPYRGAVIIGAGLGGAIALVDVGRRLAEDKPPGPQSIVTTLPDKVSSIAGKAFGIKGDFYTPTGACATSNIAMGAAYELIKSRKADFVLTGGVEASVVQGGLSMFSIIKALYTGDDINGSKPFDQDHDGFVMGEGGVIYVFEDLDHAVARGAIILAEVMGYGHAADAEHDVKPNGIGAEQAIREAMVDAGPLKHEGIVYVNAHGTSTEAGDGKELLAIKRAHADEVAVSSTKGMHGHILGGAGAVELGISLLAMRNGLVLPNVGLVNPIPEADGVDLVKTTRRAVTGRIYEEGFGFGGNNSVIVVDPAPTDIAEWQKSKRRRRRAA
jgi:3-oxoacyl-[acyl-carrier-protein] synthase II